VGILGFPFSLESVAVFTDFLSAGHPQWMENSIYIVLEPVG